MINIPADFVTPSFNWNISSDKKLSVKVYIVTFMYLSISKSECPDFEFFDLLTNAECSDMASGGPFQMEFP